MQPVVQSARVDSVEAHPVSELLECPPETSLLLTSAALSINFDAGQIVFSQHSPCKGLYLVVSGLFMRRTERLGTRIVLGAARPGDLVELATALGDRLHTYSLVAHTAASVLLLPIEALQQAFQSHPPLRMKLLEELAREVSRAYRVGRTSKLVRARRRPISSLPV